jgi:hypothetical protein
MNKTLPERMALLRLYAIKLNICTNCFIRENNNTGRGKRCQKCTTAKNLAAKKRREKEENCNRCGQKNDRIETHKTCTKCYLRQRKYYKIKKQKNENNIRHRNRNKNMAS